MLTSHTRKGKQEIKLIIWVQEGENIKENEHKMALLPTFTVEFIIQLNKEAEKNSRVKLQFIRGNKKVVAVTSPRFWNYN